MHTCHKTNQYAFALTRAHIQTYIPKRPEHCGGRQQNDMPQPLQSNPAPCLPCQLPQGGRRCCRRRRQGESGGDVITGHRSRVPFQHTSPSSSLHLISHLFRSFAPVNFVHAVLNLLVRASPKRHVQPRPLHLLSSNNGAQSGKASKRVPNNIERPALGVLEQELHR